MGVLPLPNCGGGCGPSHPLAPARSFLCFFACNAPSFVDLDHCFTRLQVVLANSALGPTLSTGSVADVDLDIKSLSGDSCPAVDISPTVVQKVCVCRTASSNRI